MLFIGSVASVQAATLIEIYGKRENVEFRRSDYLAGQYVEYGPSVKRDVEFSLSFIDHNDDGVFNSGDILSNGVTYDKLNYSVIDLGNLSALYSSVGFSFEEPNRVYYHYYYQEEEYDMIFASYFFSFYSNLYKTGDVFVSYQTHESYNPFRWNGKIAYEFKINGVSQVVPLPWSAALLPVGLGLLAGFGRRRRAVG